jgi:hypothetical protein
MAAASEYSGDRRLDSGKSSPFIATMEENKREITLRGDNWTQSLPPAGAPIAHACVSPFSPDIALMTTQGETRGLFSATRGVDTAIAATTQ